MTAGVLNTREKLPGEELQEMERIEVNGEVYSNPSRAGHVIKKGKPCGGWGAWQYRDSSGEWRKIKNLREQYREGHGITAIQEKKAA